MKYFSKFSALFLEIPFEYFEIYFSKILIVFLHVWQNFSKLSKTIYDMVLTSRTRVCIASHSVLERIGYGYNWYIGIPVTPCFAGCIISEQTLLCVITLHLLFQISLFFRISCARDFFLPYCFKIVMAYMHLSQFIFHSGLVLWLVFLLIGVLLYVHLYAFMKSMYHRTLHIFIVID